MQSLLATLNKPGGRAVTAPDAQPGLPSGFVKPSQQHGPVPFWWWGGDPLERDRLAWQLDRLKDKGVLKAIVSYNHHADGTTEKGDPEVFSPVWWETFRWLVQECKVRGMQIGFQDYTLINPMLQEIGRGVLGMQGGQLHEISRRVTGPSQLQLEVPRENCPALKALAFPVTPDGIEAESAVDLTPHLGGRTLQWSVPEGRWLVSLVFVSPNPFDPMHPMAGSKVIERLYAPFEQHCPGEVGKTISIFFQDELDFGSRMPLWSDRVAIEFRRRKGYDLILLLPALWHNLGAKSPKVRIDYSDVVTSLLEENYFIPVYRWHEARGTLLANDNAGRGGIEIGRQHYADYFRTMRWYSAPGTDDPNINEPRAFRGLKVNSSIAHLYGRPRVWNECFHSSGWGTTPAQVIAALNEDSGFGATVVNLHGLYYSTHGSWWEWAPPDFHFRQPYWDHLDGLSSYVSRMCYLLSQGDHVCDVAMLYPITALEGGLNQRIDRDARESVPFSERQNGTLPVTQDAAEAHAFSLGQYLSDEGIDFDFIDFESVERAEVRDGQLCVGGECYRVLVLPVMSAIRFSTLRKAQEFMAAGGVVIAFGCLPVASERIGGNDSELDELVRSIFNPEAGGRGIFVPEDYALVKQAIDQSITRDFVPTNGKLRVLHRRSGAFEIYYVFNPGREAVESDVFFRAKGEAQRWNAWSGAMRPLTGINGDDRGTTLHLKLRPAEGQLIVFSPEPAPDTGDTRLVTAAAKAEVTLNGLWDFELLPTMDNRFGDFRLPAHDGHIGAEARRYRYAEETESNPPWHQPGFDDSNWPMTTCSYGPRFWKLGPIPPGADRQATEKRLAALTTIDPSKPEVIEGREYHWTPYEMSLRWGIENDPFLKDWASGPHGLKKRIPNEFIDLNCDTPFATWYLWTSAQSANQRPARFVMGSRSIYTAWLNGGRVLDQPTALPPGRHPAWNLPHYESSPQETKLTLRAGNNPLLLKFVQPEGQRVRAYAAFNPPPPNGKLALRWFTTNEHPTLNPRPQHAHHAGWYRFTAPPGLTTMRVAARGSLRVWVGGEEAPVTRQQSLARSDGDAIEYLVQVPRVNPETTVVAMRVEEAADSFAGDSLPEPILLECAKGRLPLGDWSECGLATYSGKACYRRTFSLDKKQAAGALVLDLGQVAATAEVRFNGQPAGTLIAPPWRVDLTGRLQEGENLLEIFVANTLANHYSVGIPTPYVFPGQTLSGLLGPVRLLAAEKDRE
jgi:hypothetical protein